MLSIIKEPDCFFLQLLKPLDEDQLGCEPVVKVHSELRGEVFEIVGGQVDAMLALARGARPLEAFGEVIGAVALEGALAIDGHIVVILMLAGS